MLEILFYPHGEAGPVLDYLRGLLPERAKAHGRLNADLAALATAGLRNRQIDIRSLGDGLWELKRLYDGVQYRILFTVAGGAVWLLHAFEKKSEKTPKSDIQLAQRRMEAIKWH